MIKDVSRNIRKKTFYQLAGRKRRCRIQDNGKKNTTTQPYIICLLLLLCGDVELNPGPVTSPTCNKTFTRPSYRQRKSTYMWSMQSILLQSNPSRESSFNRTHWYRHQQSTILQHQLKHTKNEHGDFKINIGFWEYVVRHHQQRLQALLCFYKSLPFW